MSKYVVGVWNVRDRRADLSSRINRLADAVELVHAIVQAKNYESSGLIRGILVAPEYFFSAQNSPMQTKGGKYINRAITVDEKEQILTHLMGISRDYPRVLIVAGSIAWREKFDEANRPVIERALNFYPRRFRYAEADAIIMRSYKIRISDNFMVESTCTDRCRPITKHELQCIKQQAPDYFARLLRDAEKLDRVSQSAKIAEAKLTLKAGPKWILHNTCPIFLNGQQVFSYSKQCNYKEEQGRGTTVFVPGARNGREEIEGIRFGFEICLDHNVGMLNSQARAGREIDVHVVMSDFVDFKPNNLTSLKVGGYFIHATTCPEMDAHTPDKSGTGFRAGVLKKTARGLERATPLYTNTIGGCNLETFEMDLETVDAFELAGTFMAD